MAALGSSRAQCLSAVSHAGYIFVWQLYPRMKSDFPNACQEPLGKIAPSQMEAGHSCTWQRGTSSLKGVYDALENDAPGFTSTFLQRMFVDNLGCFADFNVEKAIVLEKFQNKMPPPQFTQTKHSPLQCFLFRRDCFVWRKWLTWGSARKNWDFILPNPIFVSSYSSLPCSKPQRLYSVIPFIKPLNVVLRFIWNEKSFSSFPIGSLIDIVSLVLSFSLWDCLPVNLYLLIWADTVSFENGFTHSIKTHWPLLYSSAYFCHKDKLSTFRFLL